MSMVNLVVLDTGWGVFTTAGTTGIHYCWLCLWCPVLLSTAGTGIQYCYPLVVDQRFSSDKIAVQFLTFGSNLGGLMARWFDGS